MFNLIYNCYYKKCNFMKMSYVYGDSSLSSSTLQQPSISSVNIVKNFTSELNEVHPNYVDKCLIRSQNRTILFSKNIYEGIPETLIFNVIAWIVLILIFSILRKHAWDYGRLGLVNRGKKFKRKWTQVFYARTDSIEATSNESSFSHQNLSNPNYIDNGFFSWIYITFKLKESHFLKYCGPDSVHYLSFQRHIIFVMSIITIISICVILPINFQGDLFEDVNAFGRTTVSNLKPQSQLLWAHVIVTIICIPLVVLTMRLSSGRNAFKRAPTKTIMIKNLTQNFCKKPELEQYIHLHYPHHKILNIEFAFNVYELTQEYEKYQQIREARKYCQRKPVNITTCFCYRKTNALEYYEFKEAQLKRRVDELRVKALEEPLGIAFVTFEKFSSATEFLTKFKQNRLNHWIVKYAPSASDIFWENLTSNSCTWKFKWLTINIILFLVLFFLTTPIYIVNLMATFSLYKNATKQFNSIISNSIPTLMMWTLAAVMPAIVGYSEKLLYHPTRSKLNSTIMKKSFGYLLFMILILPSLGLTSAQAFLEWTLTYTLQDQNYRWECVFAPGRGAFYVNYVITAAFIGTALELIRLPELIYYSWQLFTVKSKAEINYIRENLVNEYPYGTQYAWVIMVFTMSTVYSLACPLIMPFAMIYIGLKHFVDRHNLFFAYGSSNMISRGGGKIHFTAVTMTKTSVVLLLIIMFVLTSIRGQTVDMRSAVLIVTMNVTLIMFAFMSTIKKCALIKTTSHEGSESIPNYVPDVLIDYDNQGDSQTEYNTEIEDNLV